MVEDRKARRTFIETGARDGQRVEVLKKKSQDAKAKEQWLDFSREERIIEGNLSALTDGKAVQVVEKK